MILKEYQQRKKVSLSMGRMRGGCLKIGKDRGYEFKI